jgi:exonuclease V gamma subunit
MNDLKEIALQKLKKMIFIATITSLINKPLLFFKNILFFKIHFFIFLMVFSFLGNISE